jgi:hypothetical protein
MSFLDKLLGREKKAPGDMAGDPAMRGEAMPPQEKEGAAEEPAPMHEEHPPEAPERDS